MQHILDRDPYLELLKDSSPGAYFEYLESLIHDIESARVLISYKFTPSEILSRVAEIHSILRIGILQHPNCPRKLIDWAIQEGSEETINALIKTPLEISGDELADIWEKCELSQRVALTSRHDCPADVIMSTWHSDFSADSLFESNREVAFRNIASNPNIPKKLVVEFMKYPLETILDGNESLGQLLIQNPGISDETKALLALQGVRRVEARPDVDVQRMMYWWPSNHAFRDRDIDQKFRSMFSAVAHPEGILDQREELASSTYSTDITLQFWAFEEKKRIYKCLWPELAENPKVNFFYSARSWEGDFSYIGIAGELDLSDESFRNKLSGDQNWVVPDRTLSYDDVVQEIADRGFIDILESEPTEEIIISAALVEMSESGLFSISEKGKIFVRDAGNNWFEDDVTYAAAVKSEPDQKVWGQLDTKRQEAVVQIISSALQSEDGQNFKFAEYLGALIVLNPNTLDSMRAVLGQSSSQIIKQALNV